MTTFLLPLASFRSLVPPTILFGLAPHYFLINSSAQILKLFLPPTVNEKIDEFIYHTYQSLVTYFFSTFVGSKIIFYGDSVIGNTKENVLYISNHQSAIDWSLVNFISIHCGSMGQIRYILKNLLKYLPFYGIYFMQHGCVFVQTKGRVNDEDDLRRRLQKFKKDRVNGYWLVIFPEGTRFSENKTHLVEKSSQLAKQAGITPFENVLFPRTKGVELCIEELTNLDAIYDITLGFKTPWLGVEVKKEGPSLLEFVSIYGREVHIDFQRIDIVDVPKDKDGIKTWLYERFQRKDKILSHFCNPSSNGVFPGTCYDMPIKTSQTLPYALFHIVLLGATLSFETSRKIYKQVSMVALFAWLMTPIFDKIIR
ncbi:1-acyl-sn-glycerol-3-phosphate acyltransferase epsilon isoform X2 [Hydra vulgaris]|uniref:1-acyl-sn-glycerol-3-phosphate acyltransferase epsilon isoform X2 n=1 Tax=Hydra vulgaris TaxID=6087 RepID=A0ABM4D6N5_HYDVU